jgi:hypothetical protein
MQAQLIRVGIIVGVAVVAALSVGYTTRHLQQSGGAPPEQAQVGPRVPAAAPQPRIPVDTRVPPPTEMGRGAPPPMALPQAIPVTNGPILPETVPPLEGTSSHRSHGGGVRARALPGLVPPNLPGIDPHDPSTWPAELRPPAAAGEPLGGGSPPPSEKVLSYFQRTKTQIDTKMAFGFVLFPRVAITAEEKQTQMDFCEAVLASLDFMTPGAVSAAVAEHHEILATYWPIDAARNSFEVSTAFAARDCGDLIAWYDHKLARALAAKAGVAQLGGPLLITWPSSGASERDRDPLVVDFSKANHERAMKALQYWFRQLRNKPHLWTSRIREGTIRAELADAVNDTAGVMLTVLSGKWDTLTTVTASATP